MKLWDLQEIKSLKNLKNKGFNDADVAKILGRTTESVRKKRIRCNKSNIAGKNYFYTEEPENLVNPIEFLSEQVDASKFELVQKDELKKFTTILKSRSLADMLADKIEKSIKVLPPITKKDMCINKIKHKGSEEVAVLLLSDLHVGLTVNPEETFGLGKYSISVFKDRCKRLTESVIKITDLHRHLYPVNKLAIFCLGDLVHGMNSVGKWSSVYIEQDVITQVFECVNELEKMICKLAQIFDSIEFYGTAGNHGKMSNHEEEKGFVNWDYLGYKYLERGLSNQEHIKFFIDKSWFQIAEVHGHKFLLTHGDGIFGGPNGFQRAEMRYRELIEQFKSPEDASVILTPYLENLSKHPNDLQVQFELINASMRYAKGFNTMCVAHYHSPNVWSTSAGNRIIMNGSFVGGDNYSMKRLQAAQYPSQKFFGIGKKRLTWHYDLELEV